MSLHSKAWQGLDILVFGDDSHLTEKIAEAISANSPSQELKVHAFSDYNEAHSFCKRTKSVGFIFILEGFGDAPMSDIFLELSKPYETRGLPCFGVLLHKEGRSISGHTAMAKTGNLLEYVSVDNFDENIKLSKLLQSLWRKQVEATERFFIPDALQSTVISLSTESFSDENRLLQWRFQELISGKSNISWLDGFTLEWAHLIYYARLASPKAISPHASLINICKVDEFQLAYSVQNIEEVVGSGSFTWMKISAIANILVRYKNEGRLHQELEQLSQRTRPFSASLLRIIKNDRDKILGIADENFNSGLSKNAG